MHNSFFCDSSNRGKACLVFFLGSGKVFTGTGVKLFAILSLMDYAGIENSLARASIATLGVISVGYTYSTTRLPPLWYAIKNKSLTHSGQRESSEEESFHLSTCQAIITYIIVILGLINGLIPLSVYLASKTILSAMRLNNTVLFYIFFSYNTLSSFTAYAGFNVKIAYENAVYIIKAISTGRQCDRVIALRILKTIVVSFFGIYSAATLEFFYSKNGLKAFTASIDRGQNIVVPLAAIQTSLDALINTVGQPTQIYKFFTNKKQVFPKINHQRLHGNKKIKMGVHVFLGLMYVLFYGMISYISVISAEKDLNLNKVSLVQALAIFTALSSMMLEFTFTFSAMFVNGYAFFANVEHHQMYRELTDGSTPGGSVSVVMGGAHHDEESPPSSTEDDYLLGDQPADSGVVRVQPFMTT